MTCADFEILLCDYIDGAVAEDGRRTLEQHAEVCGSCRDLLRDATDAVSFIGRVEEIAPPPELITRLAYHAPRGKVRDGLDRDSLLSRTFTRWFQPVLQPRFAMGMAMTILSFAMLGRCTGVQLQQIRPADLSPTKVWGGVEDKAYRSWDRTVKYYENLRLVYEIETRVKEIREQQNAADRDAAPANQPSASPSPQQNNGGTKP
jgi:putative zinc finger protein